MFRQCTSPVANDVCVFFYFGVNVCVKCAPSFLFRSMAPAFLLLKVKAFWLLKDWASLVIAFFRQVSDLVWISFWSRFSPNSPLTGNTDHWASANRVQSCHEHILVGVLEHVWFSIGNVIIPIDELIVFRGVGSTTNQYPYSICSMYEINYKITQM